MADQQKLSKEVEKQAKRMKQAEHDKPTLLAQTVYLGTLGFLFVVPVIGGAYLGLWIDRQIEGYSVIWTISCTCIGIIIGTINVYFYVRE